MYICISPPTSKGTQMHCSSMKSLISTRLPLGLLISLHPQTKLLCKGSFWWYGHKFSCSAILKNFPEEGRSLPRHPHFEKSDSPWYQVGPRPTQGCPDDAPMQGSGPCTRTKHTQPYNQLDIDSLVNQIKQDTSK